MNLVTKADIKRFLQLLEIGLKEGKKVELKNYTSADTHDGTNIAKSYYVSIEFCFHCATESIGALVDSDAVDDEIKEMIKTLNK